MTVAPGVPATPAVVPGVDDSPLDFSASAPVALPVVHPAAAANMAMASLPCYSVAQLEFMNVQADVAATPLPVDEDENDPANPETEKETVHVRLRRVLKALPLVGTAATKARKEVDKEEVKKWSSSMGAPPKEKDRILG